MEYRYQRLLKSPVSRNVAGKERKSRDAEDKNRRHDADGKTRSAEAFQEQLEKGRLQDNGKTQSPEKLNERHAHDIFFKAGVFILVHRRLP